VYLITEKRIRMYVPTIRDDHVITCALPPPSSHPSISSLHVSSTSPQPKSQQQGNGDNNQDDTKFDTSSDLGRMGKKKYEPAGIDTLASRVLRRSINLDEDSDTDDNTIQDEQSRFLPAVAVSSEGQADDMLRSSSAPPKQHTTSASDMKTMTNSSTNSSDNSSSQPTPKPASTPLPSPNKLSSTNEFKSNLSTDIGHGHSYLSGASFNMTPSRSWVQSINVTDPSASSWHPNDHRVPRLSNIPNKRTQWSGVAVYDKLFIFGSDTSSPIGTPASKNERTVIYLDLITHEWITLPGVMMNVSRRQPSVVWCCRNKLIYIINGDHSTKKGGTVELFDPITLSFVTSPSDPNMDTKESSPLPSALSQSSSHSSVSIPPPTGQATLYGQSSVYIASMNMILLFWSKAGMILGPTSQPMMSVLMYSLEQNTWTDVTKTMNIPVEASAFDIKNVICIPLRSNEDDITSTTSPSLLLIPRPRETKSNPSHYWILPTGALTWKTTSMNRDSPAVPSSSRPPPSLASSSFHCTSYWKSYKWHRASSNLAGVLDVAIAH
jgi:hypothetical protein